jgi:hypothetical protein
MSGPILRALDALNDRLSSADAIGQALDLAGGDHPAPWVDVYRTQFEAIREASEALETLLRGDGGCAPHGDELSNCTDVVRGPGGTLPGSRSCPEKRSSTVSD